MKNHFFRNRLKTTMLASLLLAGLWAGLHSARATPVAVSLKPFNDPMPSALPRQWDAGNRQFNAFVDGPQVFSYQNASVVVSYEPGQATSYFSGTINATGLKPNFWYQMKLAGKPKYGSRGWGDSGDDVANANIGYAGRWWGDEVSRQWNIDSDTEYENTYGSVADPALKKTVYGYIYMAGFLTDENGSYGGPINGSRSCHVTWQDWQSAIGNKNAVALDSRYLSSNSSYGYGYNFDSGSSGATNPVLIHNPVKLWYEYEARAGRIRRNTVQLPDGTYQVKLPAGNYNCRFLLTEESFHNNFGGGTDNDNGGFWHTVLSNEDFGIDPVTGLRVADSDPANDIAFTISPPVLPVVSASSVAVTVTRSGSSRVGKATVKIINSATGAAVSGASVSGSWSGAYNSATVTATSSSTGLAVFTTPKFAKNATSTLTFSVTKIVKSGMNWDGVIKSGSALVP